MQILDYVYLWPSFLIEFSWLLQPPFLVVLALQLVQHTIDRLVIIEHLLSTQHRWKTTNEYDCEDDM